MTRNGICIVVFMIALATATAIGGWQIGKHSPRPYVSMYYTDATWSDNADPAHAPKHSAHDRVTKTQYDRLIRGMTYEDVALIMGFPGVEDVKHGRSEPDLIARMYSWDNTDGRSGVLTQFVNGRLIRKTNGYL